MKFAACLTCVAALTVSAALAQAPAAPTTPAPAPEAPKAAPVAPAAMVDEAKIVIEDKAEADGRIEVVFTPQGGAPTTVTVLVAKKMKGREIAEDLAKNIKVTMGDGYKVEQNDEKIEIKGKDKKMFSVAIGANTVAGVSVKIK